MLNKLPLFEDRPDAASFRNPNGVGLKLSNFLNIDPAYPGKGMAAHSKLDGQVFFEFNDDREKLGQIAKNIRQTVSNPYLMRGLGSIVKEPEEEYYSAKEGEILLKLPQYRERNPTLVAKKKKAHLKKHGNLACELCAFDFEKVYGEVGKGFIECHHKVPLSELGPDTATKLDDLMVICANCHRMVHRGWGIARHEED